MQNGYWDLTNARYTYIFFLLGMGPIDFDIEKHDEIVAGYTRVIDQALAETEDRLTNGDHVLYQGEIIRVPMKGKDTAVVAAIGTDKMQLLLSRPTSISGKGMADDHGVYSAELDKAREQQELNHAIYQDVVKQREDAALF